MDGIVWIVIAFLAVVIFLGWRFDAVRFTRTALGFEGSAEASRAEKLSAHARHAEQPSHDVTASGDGAVVVGGNAEKANISTNVNRSSNEGAKYPGSPSRTETQATGDGAVAVGGDAKDAKISTDVTNTK